MEGCNDAMKRLFNEMAHCAEKHFLENGVNLTFGSMSPDMTVCHVKPESKEEEVARFLFKHNRTLYFVEINGRLYHRSMAFCNDIIRR